jgi:Transposase DDE domain group 1
VNNTARRPKITVSADGQGLVSQAGALLLLEAARVTGLGRGLSAGLARWRAPRAVHERGKIVADLVVALALGGDCLADIAVLRAQPELAGPVASDPVVSRLVTALAADAPRALRAIRKARATARQRAWVLAGERAPGADGSLIPVDIDATIVIAHSEKEQAAATWKKTFGLLTELRAESSQFSEHSCSALVTVPARGRWRAVFGRGGAGRPAGWRAAGDG